MTFCRQDPAPVAAPGGKIQAWAQACFPLSFSRMEEADPELPPKFVDVGWGPARDRGGEEQAGAGTGRHGGSVGVLGVGFSQTGSQGREGEWTLEIGSWESLGHGVEGALEAILAVSLAG